MRVFLDANILFSAAYFPGSKVEEFVLDLIAASQVVVLTSAYAVSETQKNLLVKRPSGILHLETILNKIEMIDVPMSIHCPIDLPEKDHPIFVAAIHGRATHLITGDRKHFGKWMNKPKQTRGIIIQTIADFLQ